MLEYLQRKFGDFFFKNIIINARTQSLLNQKVSNGYDLIAFSVDFRMLETVARKPFEDV